MQKIGCSGFEPEIKDIITIGKEIWYGFIAMVNFVQDYYSHRKYSKSYCKNNFSPCKNRFKKRQKISRSKKDKCTKQKLGLI